MRNVMDDNESAWQSKMDTDEDIFTEEESIFEPNIPADTSNPSPITREQERAGQRPHGMNSSEWKKTLVAMADRNGSPVVAKAVRHKITGEVRRTESFRMPTVQEINHLKKNGQILGAAQAQTMQVADDNGNKKIWRMVMIGVGAVGAGALGWWFWKRRSTEKQFENLED